MFARKLPLGTNDAIPRMLPRPSDAVKMRWINCNEEIFGTSISGAHAQADGAPQASHLERCIVKK
jgi:hypothetical protein